jgi:prepilin-type processing-associated H-X9-DG protein
MSAVQSTATKIMVMEGSYNGTFLSNSQNTWTGNIIRDRGFAGHLSTANYLYADGHVKAMKPTATMRGINQWGRGNGTDDTDACGAFTSRSNYINCDEPEPGWVSNGLVNLEDRFK